MNKTRIHGDLYDIANRIRQIDDSYYIVRDYKLNRFEVHSNNQKGNTLCVVIPYDKLDCRTLHLLQKTHVQRHKQLMQEIQDNNDKLLKQENRQIIEKAKDTLNNIIK